MAQYYEGFCRLCGSYGKLSFEHIPPKKAFNNHQQLLRTMEDHLSKRSHSRFRKGLGTYSLCERCNNYTGAWYGEAFVAWTKQGYEWLDQVHGEKMLNLPYYIRPLNVLKQVLVMAVAMSTAGSLNAHRELRQFLLNPRQRHMPSDYRAFAYFGMKGQLRFNSGMALLDTEGKGADFIMAEVALPPFGYCVTRPVGDRRPWQSQRVYMTYHGSRTMDLMSGRGFICESLHVRHIFQARWTTEICRVWKKSKLAPLTLAWMLIARLN